jgi:biopolymer transport protein ExbD
MKLNGRGSSLQAEINVTPLVDVCLVLLVIFMVVTPILIGQVNVTLPDATSAVPTGEQHARLTVSLTSDGTLYAGGAIVREEDARAAIQKAAAQDVGRPVIVHADKDVTHGRVVRILDMCREAGFDQVAVATYRTPESLK